MNQPPDHLIVTRLQGEQAGRAVPVEYRRFRNALEGLEDELRDLLGDLPEYTRDLLATLSNAAARMVDHHKTTVAGLEAARALSDQYRDNKEAA